MDVDSYLDRLELSSASPIPDAEWLKILHRAHVTTIPFENLDVALGRGIDLDIDVLQDKLLHRKRGGYCFEHNLLFAAVLEQLGFPVVRLAGRVHPDKPGPRTHLLLLTWADDRWWLADVGFGGYLLDPLPLVPSTATQDGWSYRLTSVGDAWRLHALSPDGWTDLYDFTMEPLEPIDCEVHNHYTATHPRSPFTGQVIAIQATPGRRHLLQGRVLTTKLPRGVDFPRHLSATEVVNALRVTFDIHLSGDELNRLLPILQEA